MKIGLVSCSNALSSGKRSGIDSLTRLLEENGIEVLVSPFLYERQGVGAGDGLGCYQDVRGGSARERARVLMQYFQEPEMDYIFDVSGGDIANEILPWLDFSGIRESRTVFAGYSDLTTILNAIYAKMGKAGILYQVRHLAAEENLQVREMLMDELFVKDAAGREEPWKPGVKYHFIRRSLAMQDFVPDSAPAQGSSMQGVLVGGNIRCLLKLAGTEYFPDMRDKILLLEAMSGDVAKMITYLSQLDQLGVFRQIRGVLLGTFTQMERENLRPSIEELILEYLPSDLPVAKTFEVGHGIDAKPIWIGREYRFEV